MSTRSQKRKAVEELVSGEFEFPRSNTLNNIPEQVPGTSNQKFPRIQPENLDAIKTSIRTEIMSDLAETLAENHKEMLKLIAPVMKEKTVRKKVSDIDSESENISPVIPSSTPIKSGKLKTKKQYDMVAGRNNLFIMKLFQYIQ